MYLGKTDFTPGGSTLSGYDIITAIATNRKHESIEINRLKSVQKLEAVKIFLLAISEITAGLSLFIYRWQAVSEQNMKM